MAVDVMAQLRLDKYLADMGIGTRSQIKEAAKKGRIQVNGQTGGVCHGRPEIPDGSGSDR